MSISTAENLSEQKLVAIRSMANKRRIALAAPILIGLYFLYLFFAFDVQGLIKKASWENAQTLVSDSYSYKTHVTYDTRSKSYKVAIEGERKGTYPDGKLPVWLETVENGLHATLGEGYEATLAGGVASFIIPEFGTITAEPSRRGVIVGYPGGVDTDNLPNWISQSKNRLSVTTARGRLTVTRSRAELFKYSLGWELFFFTLDSPFSGKSFGEIVGLAFSSNQVFEGKSNLGAMFHDFWNNKMWQHREVVWAIFETILMAFLGTMGAGIIALPLAFLAAKNFTPLVLIRTTLRRFFDLLRGVDALIWTIILARAFGPGPLTGSLAILFTDTGTFGKLFSEALENVDEKQIEGVQSTGAKPLQRYRFGVIPQIIPILVSQLLYYLESNTRSATIIGAITGGGIGLLLTQAMITQKDWEEVSYYIILIVLMVMIMDTVSGWLRTKIIGRDS